MLHVFDHDFLGINDFRVLESLPAYSCVLGGCHKPNLKEYIYVVVLIDENQLQVQIAERKIQDPGNAWSEDLIFNHPDSGYYTIQQTAKKYNIPVFKTFGGALDFIIVKIIENE